MRIPGSLSLSLSLSSIGEESERRGWRELALGWVQPPWLSPPTTLAVTSNHPAYHIGSTYTLQTPPGQRPEGIHRMQRLPAIPSPIVRAVLQ